MLALNVIYLESFLQNYIMAVLRYRSGVVSNMALGSAILTPVLSYESANHKIWQIINFCWQSSMFRGQTY
jgi:hypothetical protein